MIVSDRKESVSDGSENEVTKFHLDAGGEFFLALAGDAFFIKLLFTRLSSGYGDTDTIIDQLESYGRAHFTQHKNVTSTPVYGTGHSEGFLVLRKNKEYTPYTVKFIKDDFVINHTTAPFYTVGDTIARLMVQHTLRNANFLQHPCEMLAQYLLASMADAAQLARFVGDMEYGFDVFAFMENGQILCRNRYADERTRIKVLFEQSPEVILSECGAGGI